jgi:ABC-2 type transport system ATP-binding protein
MIEAAGLSKSFEDVQAVVDVGFTVSKGELFGFLGPNGAGKTTTINMLTGLARPDKGNIKVGGIDCSANPKAAQHLIGIVPDESNLYPELTGYGNLTFCASLYGMRKKPRERRAEELLEMFGLKEAAHRKFSGYSKGMKRKLTIAAGIIHKPPMLFLDEPTTGIDVASARQIRQLIADLHHEGTTILLTTHYIEEAERLCDRIAFIVMGRIARVESVEYLLEPVREKYVLRFIFDSPVPDAAAAISEAFPHLQSSTISPTQVRIEGKDKIPLAPLIHFLDARGTDVIEARRQRPSLEDVFVEITGIEADAMKREKEKKGGKG